MDDRQSSSGQPYSYGSIDRQVPFRACFCACLWGPSETVAHIQNQLAHVVQCSWRFCLYGKQDDDPCSASNSYSHPIVLPSPKHRQTRRIQER